VIILVQDLRSLDLSEMLQLMEELNEPAFRAKQLFAWVHNKEISSLDEAGNLGKGLLEKLSQKVLISSLNIVKKQVSQDGTTKFLLALPDGNYIECVLMCYRGDRSKKRNTLCISTQVGCAMGCGFCATGKSGFTRNLTVGEILGQVYTVNNFLSQEKDGYKIGNVVYMGMGEPLLNYANVIKSVRLLNSKDGQNISMRRITISSCGIAPQIKKLADQKLDLVLAISLHAPTNELRSKIMPINHKYPLEKLKKACQYYNEVTKKRITFEYALIKDFNDQPQHSKELAQFLKGIHCHVNLIPINSVPGSSFTRPSKKRIYEFLREIKELGVEVSIREEKGTDIDAACGQLRGKVVN